YPRYSATGVLRSKELEAVLEEVRIAFKNNPNLSVEVIGHTDNVGNAEDNYQLALNLAQQVRWYLVAKGPFSKHRIKASSKGESEAIASNQTERGRALNQRMEIKFTE
ncbi:MAG: OmpA family protein, partial [Marinirhabdus sp.]|nr:OmpA family protein [Marinirhabdus sp.]